MHFFILIGVLVLCYLVYALLRTQRRVDAELREIRKKCVSANTNGSNEPMYIEPSSAQLMNDATNKLTNGLQKLMSLAT